MDNACPLGEILPRGSPRIDPTATRRLAVCTAGQHRGPERPGEMVRGFIDHGADGEDPGRGTTNRSRSGSLPGSLRPCHHHGDL